MNAVDHIFILLLFVVQPIHGYLTYRHYLARIAAGEQPDRIAQYRQILTLEWIAFAVVAATWALLGRPAAALGFVASSSIQIWGGLGVLALVTGYALYAWRAARKMSPEEKSKQAEVLGDLIYILPKDDRDYRHFIGVSITAGIVEEFLYRGFVFWYLSNFMPIWAVIAVSSLAFGLGHTYQGAAGVARVTVIGLVIGTFYVLTGSIWLPMLAHAILDILQGAGILEILRKTDDQAPEQHPDPC